MVLEERKEDQLVKAFLFSSISSVSAGFKKDEFYLTFSESNESKPLSYKVFHEKHRDLLLELLWYARERSRLRLLENQEKVQNPNVDKSIDVKEFIAKERTTSHVKLLKNDRVLPPEISFRCVLTKKSSGLLSQDKPCFMLVGVKQVVIAMEERAEHIINAFPIEQDCFQFSRIKEGGAFQIIFGGTKHIFKANRVQDVEKLEELFAKSLAGDFSFRASIQSLPFQKRDANVTILLKENLKSVLEKIEVKVKELEELISEKTRLEVLLKVEDDRESKPDIFAERKSLCDIENPDELRNLLSLNKSTIRLLTGRGIKTPDRSREPSPDNALNRSRVVRKESKPNGEQKYEGIKATVSMTAYRVGDQNKYEEYDVTVEQDDDYDDYEYDHETVKDETPQLRMVDNYSAQIEKAEKQQPSTKKKA